MPRMYDQPVVFLKALSLKIQEGWVLTEFDYDRERVVLKKDDEILMAHSRRGRVEWRVVKAKPPEIVKGTDRFFIV